MGNRTYLDRVLLWLNMAEAKACPTPGVEAHRAARAGSPPMSGDDAWIYRSCVMRLMFYLHGREDAQFGISHLAAQMSAPVDMDMVALKRLVRYLVGTIDYAVKLVISVGDPWDGTFWWFGRTAIGVGTPKRGRARQACTLQQMVPLCADCRADRT